jgi:hypothetical protein
LKVDPIALVINYLKAQPELTGIPVIADLVGHNSGELAVQVDLGGGGRYVRDKADHWVLTINYYGPTKRDTVSLALTVREILLERLPTQRISGVTVADVHEGHAPTDHSDSVIGEQRILHLVSLFIYS